MDPAAVVLGLISALSWGGSDFLGGLASRAIGSLTTATVAQAIGLLAVAIVALLAAESAPGQAEILWSVAAGVGGGLGIATLYRALASGEMGLVAPLTGAIGAGAPGAISFALGERVAPLQAAGIAFALAAVVVASVGTRTGVISWRLIPLAVAAGLGFAAFYVAMDRAASQSGHVWSPLLMARMSAVAVFLIVALATRGVSLGAAARRLPMLVLVGLGDLGGNVFFILANANGPLSVAVVLSSLYPVTTAMLARMVLGERLRRPQLLGAGLAIAGITLIAV
jgi:drug/metabolite transporter (DMT)-like permease